MKFIIIYITYPNLKDAKKVSEVLLKEKLIACVNYFPMESSYQWKGKIESAKEIVAIAKTRKENWAKVKKSVEKLHSYEVPCIMKIEVEFNKAYADWILKETKN